VTDAMVNRKAINVVAAVSNQSTS